MKIKFPKNGRFGEFGGKYIPETLVPAIEELEQKTMCKNTNIDFSTMAQKLCRKM